SQTNPRNTQSEGSQTNSRNTQKHKYLNTKASGSQQTILSMIQSTAPHKGIKKLNLRRTIVEWLVIDNQSFEVINGEGFCRFMLQADSAFHWPSYKSIKKDISLANVNAKQQINDLLTQSKEENDISVEIQENLSEYNPKIIEKDIKSIIYDSLFEYWNHPSQTCLLTTLLDPLLKEMVFVDNEIRDNTINEYRHQLHKLMNIQQPISDKSATLASATNLLSNNMFKNLIFGKAQKSQAQMNWIITLIPDGHH
ncbi:23991_t:CDS:2, partial [Gigaspora margarita]